MITNISTQIAKGFMLTEPKPFEEILKSTEKFLERELTLKEKQNIRRHHNRWLKELEFAGKI